MQHCQMKQGCQMSISPTRYFLHLKISRPFIYWKNDKLYVIVSLNVWNVFSVAPSILHDHSKSAVPCGTSSMSNVKRNCSSKWAKSAARFCCHVAALLPNMFCILWKIAKLLITQITPKLEKISWKPKNFRNYLVYVWLNL